MIDLETTAAPNLNFSSSSSSEDAQQSKRAKSSGEELWDGHNELMQVIRVCLHFLTTKLLKEQQDDTAQFAQSFLQPPVRNSLVTLIFFSGIQILQRV